MSLFTEPIKEEEETEITMNGHGFANLGSAQPSVQEFRDIMMEVGTDVVKKLRSVARRAPVKKRKQTGAGKKRSGAQKRTQSGAGRQRKQTGGGKSKPKQTGAGKKKKNGGARKKK
jgi:hypothetical protein